MRILILIFSIIFGLINFCSLAAEEELLTVRPRKESQLMGRKDEISVIREFGNFIEECNTIDLDNDSEEKIESCEKLRLFIQKGWESLVN